MPTKQEAAAVRWFKPPHGWFKINVDGPFKASSGRATRGDLIRDFNDRFVKGYF